MPVTVDAATPRASAMSPADLVAGLGEHKEHAHLRHRDTALGPDLEADRIEDADRAGVGG
jgi:hypothetical protein